MKILLVNGPNLQLLGQREPETYGSGTLEHVEALVKTAASELGVTAECRQSNHEGKLVGWLGEDIRDFDGFLLNAGAYTHTSVAIRDAVASTNVPGIEIHISNIFAREKFRHESIIAPVCLGQISGLGIAGYEWALRALVAYLRSENKKGD